MIISPEQIWWLITGNRVDDKSLIKLAKLHGIVVPDSLRKNLHNAINAKHQLSITTVTIIKRFFSKISANNPDLMSELDDIDFNEKVETSYFDNAKGFYKYFFMSAGLEGSFIECEVNKLFSGFENIKSAYLKGKLTEEMAYESITNDDLLSHLISPDDLIIDLGDTDTACHYISINITLYILSCFELTTGSYENKDSTGKETLVTIINDNNEEKSKNPFGYFTHFMKNKTNKSNKEVAEILGIGIRQYQRKQKEGKGLITRPKLLNAVLDTGGVLYYFFPAIWLKIISLLKPAEIDINILVDKYNEYFSLAQKRFEK